MPVDPDTIANLDAILAGLGRCISSGFLIPRTLEIAEKFRRHVTLFEAGMLGEVFDRDLCVGNFSIVRAAFNCARDYHIEYNFQRAPVDLGIMQEVLQGKIELVYLARLVKSGFLIPRYYNPRDFVLDVTLCALEGTTVIPNLYLEEFTISSEVLDRIDTLRRPATPLDVEERLIIDDTV